MSKKMYKLILGIVGGFSTVCSAVVAYCDINNTPAIIAAIGVANTAIAEICALFVTDSETK